MEADALKKIIELALVSAGRLPDTQVPTAVLPSGVGVCSLEQFMAAPARMRQVFDTARPADFIAYIKENLEESTTVYIAPDGVTAVCLLDNGTTASPKFAEHRAELGLIKTRAFAALLGATHRAHNQQSMIDFIEDWADGTITCQRGEQIIPTALAIAAIRKIEINSAGKTTIEHNDFSVSSSSVASLDVKGANDALPTSLLFNAPMYEGTQPRAIQCRISVSGDDKPALRIRLMQIERHEQSVAEEIEALIRSSVDCRVFIGKTSR